MGKGEAQVAGVDQEGETGVSTPGDNRGPGMLGVGSQYQDRLLP